MSLGISEKDKMKITIPGVQFHCSRRGGGWEGGRVSTTEIGPKQPVTICCARV